MFSHNKRLRYTVRVGEADRGLADLMLERFGSTRAARRCPAKNA